MTEGVLVLPHIEGIVHGQDVVIVPADAEALTTGGIREHLEKMGARVKSGYHQVAERTEELVQAAREERQASAKKVANNWTGGESKNDTDPNQNNWGGRKDQV